MQLLFIAGNIGGDAVLRTTQGGDKVSNFSVAVDNGKDKQGQRRESTWYECSLWGKRGEALNQFLTKGGKVTISGRPTVRVYEGKAYLGVSVDQITLQGGNSDNRGGGDAGGSAPAGGAELPIDDIPFNMACRYALKRFILRLL